MRKLAADDGLSRAEAPASVVLSALSGILCLLAAHSAGFTHHVLTLVDLACACGLLALALTPSVLFRSVSFHELREREPVSTWTSCAFGILALFWTAYAAAEWVSRSS
jgi:hypothetical protein